MTFTAFEIIIFHQFHVFFYWPKNRPQFNLSNQSNWAFFQEWKKDQVSITLSHSMQQHLLTHFCYFAQLFSGYINDKIEFNYQIQYHIYWKERCNMKKKIENGKFRKSIQRKYLQWYHSRIMYHDFMKIGLKKLTQEIGTAKSLCQWRIQRP